MGGCNVHGESLLVSGDQVGMICPTAVCARTRPYTHRAMLLYVDDVAVGAAQITSPLSALYNTNNWLGRSNFANDSELNGIFHEFRIYSVALSAAQVKMSFNAGNDPVELR